MSAAPSYTLKRKVWETVIQQVVPGINIYYSNQITLYHKRKITYYGRKCLVKTCGYFPSKKKSRDRMWTFLKGKDKFVCLPTGFGKTACYGILLMGLMELLQDQ